jgi:hypothetical protein
MSENLFGSLDVDDIPDDPYFTGEGVYDAIVTRAEATETRAGDNKIVFEYTIDDYEPEEGEEDYSGNTVSEWWDHYPYMTKAELTTMESKERKKVLTTMSRVKKRIEHLGFDADDGDFILKNLVDVEVKLGVRVNDGTGDNEGRKFSNVRYVRARHLIEDDE